VTADRGDIEIRPLRESDGEALAAFGSSLRRDDWLYLDLDLLNPATTTRLINAAEAKNWRQIVAVRDGEVLGYANVRQLPGWRDHVGDVHLVISENHRRLGIGSRLAAAILEAARDLGVRKVILEMVEEQSDGRAIFEHLGFRQEAVLEGHARDDEGRLHNLLLLSYRLNE
jgi:L-amino acid N-acyltransferase YncA